MVTHLLFRYRLLFLVSVIDTGMFSVVKLASVTVTVSLKVTVSLLVPDGSA